MEVLNYRELKKEYYRMQLEEKLRSKKVSSSFSDYEVEESNKTKTSQKTKKQEYWEYLIKNN